ncbi:MAG: type IV pilus twitching motility protein PilT [Actinomycetota bacterium]
MDIEDLLRTTVDRRASDLHIRAGGPPYMRIDGDLFPVDSPPMSAADTERLAFGMMSEKQAREFQATNECDFAHAIQGLSRFRVNVFRQRGSVGMAFRRVLPGGSSFEALCLPPAVRHLADEARGLVLVTGVTGSGKTTTTAAMIHHINMTRRCHIVTIEDPIEVLHSDRMAIIDQREVGIDTNDFHSALKRMLRQDPDVIFIGEMRDVETVRAALQAADSGHLVISTLHTLNATETVNRIIDFFPDHQQMQARLSLAGTLRGIVSQRLLLRTDGKGRVPAVEVLISNGRIFEMITNPEHTHLIKDVISEGDFYGMQTFDQHLMALFKEGTITLEEAMTAATNSHDLTVALRQAGIA